MPISISLADLMIKAGLLTRDDLDESLQIAKDTGMKVSRVLIVSGCVTQANLDATIRVQQMLKDGRISLECAFKSLKAVHQTGTSLQEALTCYPA